MNKDTGGSAFPVNESPDGSTFPECGMTLRDYFAAKAMQGLLTKETWEQSGSDMFARDAYTLADAMIAERNKS
jgi:hypothetical protein